MGAEVMMEETEQVSGEIENEGAGWRRGEEASGEGWRTSLRAKRIMRVKARQTWRAETRS
jgi:hypothetical protein